MDDQTKRLSRKNPVFDRPAGACTDKGPVRPFNEDAYWIPDDTSPTDLGMLYVVADGVGGQEEGAAAAQLAILMVRDTFYQKREDGTPAPEALKQAVRHANQTVYEEAQQRQTRMGCTLAAAAVEHNQLWIAHVGDARAYRLGEDGLEQITRDDTWVQEQVEANVLTPEQAARHQLRNVVTQVLGNQPEVTVHLSPKLAIRNGERLLLCSDGLYDALSSAEISEILAEDGPAQAAKKLVAAAVAADAQDNVTAVVAALHRTIPHTEILPVNDPGPAAASSAPPNVARRRLGLALGVVTILVLGAALIAWGSWRANGDARESLLPVATVPEATAPILATATAVAPQDAVTIIQATSTLRPTEPPTPQSTPTRTMTPAPTATAVLFACVREESLLFVWQDAQINAGACGQFAQDGYVLRPGDRVAYLSPETITIQGPDEACQENEFVRIRAVEDAELVGWVLQNGLESVQPDEACRP